MISFKFELEKQEEYYKKVKEKLKTQFYQNLHFYVLPTMPEKFRNRVVFLPETFEPEKIYKKQKVMIDKLEVSWNKVSKQFIKKIKIYFPKINNLNISISPKLYGSLGSYEIKSKNIIVSPRYDRKIVEVQKLIINALVNFYNPKLDWNKKQNKAFEIQNKFFSNTKSMIKILDTEFAGKLAEESSKYLEKLKSSSNKQIEKPDNLTKSETIVFNLLLRNKNKLVSFDEVATWLWEDKSEEKYSEYAITKLIERLKKKFPKNLIQSQRGIGYIMHI